MAFSAPQATVAAAAAIGALCGFDSHYHQSDRHNEEHHFQQNGEVNGKSRELAVHGKQRPSKVGRLPPVFAPEFDGLHCYETLVWQWGTWAFSSIKNCNSIIVIWRFWIWRFLSNASGTAYISFRLWTFGLHLRLQEGNKFGFGGPQQLISLLFLMS